MVRCTINFWKWTNLKLLKHRMGTLIRTCLSHEATKDLKWWVDTIPTVYNPINHGDPQVAMTTDASLIGWGCCLDTVTTGGNWTPEEAQHDINYLEILAVFFALKSFSNALSGKHIKLMVDNTNAVSTISHSWAKNQLVHKIWEWCINPCLANSCTYSGKTKHSGT